MRLRTIVAGVLLAGCGAAVAVAQIPPWARRESERVPAEARRESRSTLALRGAASSRAFCFDDAQCGAGKVCSAGGVCVTACVYGDGTCAEGTECLDGHCRWKCQDSDVAPPTLTFEKPHPDGGIMLVPKPWQVTIPGRVRAVTIGDTGYALSEWQPDFCKTPTLLIEQWCQAGTWKPQFTGIACPGGQVCQYGVVQGTTQTAAFCGPPPPEPTAAETPIVWACNPTAAPYSDKSPDPCCVPGVGVPYVDLGVDVCLGVAGCQIDDAQCLPDKCPDTPGPQQTYPYQDAGGDYTLCHPLPDVSVCTAPDPAQSYPDATVLCFNGGPSDSMCTGQAHLDLCATATEVLHIICAPDGQYVIDITACAPGEVCEKGLCNDQPADEPICIDTDAANKPDKTGWVHGKSLITGTPVNQLDECIGPNQPQTTVQQYDCAPLSAEGKQPVVPPTACAAGEVCLFGKCVPQEPTNCVESEVLSGTPLDDVDEKASVQGTVNGQPFSDADGCASATQTFETSCTTNVDPTAGYGKFAKDCPAGKVCQDGVCTPQPVQCWCTNDTDAANDPEVAGELTVTFSTGMVIPIPDVCLSALKVDQSWCPTSDGICYHGGETDCPVETLCDPSIGACRHCVEVSDLGNDPMIVGEIKRRMADGQIVPHPDFCVGTTLQQVLCTPDGQFATAPTACAIGCDAGKCKPNLCEGKDLSDGDACTVDLCAPSTGYVSHMPTATTPTGEPCAPLGPDWCPENAVKSWQPMGQEIDLRISDLHAHDGTFYLGGYIGSGAYALLQYEPTTHEWIVVEFPAFAIDDIESFAGEMYVATMDLWRRHEGAWQLVWGADAAHPFGVQQLAVHGEWLFGTAAYASNNLTPPTSVIRWRPEGDGFVVEDAMDGLQGMGLRGLASFQGQLYGLHGKLIFRWDEAAKAWQQLAMEFPETMVNLVVHDGALFAEMADGVTLWRSVNGTDWQPVNTDGVAEQVISAQGTLYGTESGVVYRAQFDGPLGIHWKPVSPALIATTNLRLVAQGETLYAYAAELLGPSQAYQYTCPVAPTPVTCPPAAVDDGNSCTQDLCDAVTGAVTHPPLPTIDDGSLCTIDSCDIVSGDVLHEPVVVDDGFACTVDSCEPAAGVLHTPVVVDDFNACTLDECDPATGWSLHQPLPWIDDQNLCTQDTCNPMTGAIQHIPPKDFDDGNACTKDLCDPFTGTVTHLLNLSDDDACTLDSCDPAIGEFVHQPVAVDDGDECTVDTCDPATGEIMHAKLEIAPSGKSCVTPEPGPVGEPSCTGDFPRQWLALPKPDGSLLFGAALDGWTAYARLAFPGQDIDVFQLDPKSGVWSSLNVGTPTTAGRPVVHEGMLYVLATGMLIRHDPDGWNAAYVVPEAKPGQLSVRSVGGHLLLIDNQTAAIWRLPPAGSGEVAWKNITTGLPTVGPGVHVTYDRFVAHQGALLLFLFQSTDSPLGWMPKPYQVYRWNDAAQLWTLQYSFAEGQGVLNGVVSIGDDLFAAFDGGNPIFYRGVNLGSDWIPVPHQPALAEIRAMVNATGEAYLLGREGAEEQPYRLYRATIEPGVTTVTWKPLAHQPLAVATNAAAKTAVLDVSDDGQHLYIIDHSANRLERYGCPPDLMVEQLCDPQAIKVTQISAGGHHTCAIVDAPTAPGSVWCWGENDQGQLGAPAAVLPLSALPRQIPGTANAGAIAAGKRYTCMTWDDHEMTCWGIMGDPWGDQIAATPTPPPGDATPPFDGVNLQVDGRWRHVCVLNDSPDLGRSAWCWGNNAFGQLANGETNDEWAPVPVWADALFPALIQDVAVGRNFTCAVGAAGNAKCVGWNAFGQLGDGAVPGDLYGAPTDDGKLVTELTQQVEIDAGDYSVCSRDQAGAIWCWGGNAFGQLGMMLEWPKTFRSWARPVTALPKSKGLSVGSTHACAVGEDNRIRCWGDNASSKLGKAGGWFSATPLVVNPSSLPLVQVSAGQSHTCAVNPDGKAWCWGLQAYWGQLGNGLPLTMNGSYPFDPYGTVIPPVAFCDPPKNPYGDPPTNPYGS